MTFFSSPVIGAFAAADLPSVLVAMCVSPRLNGAAPIGDMGPDCLSAL